MALEVKGSASDIDDNARSDKSGEPDAMSLAQRRARLRNSLTKQVAPPDPYAPDPYMQPQNMQTQSAPVASDPEVGDGAATTVTVSPASVPAPTPTAENTSAAAFFAPVSDTPAPSSEPVPKRSKDKEAKSTKNSIEALKEPVKEPLKEPGNEPIGKDKDKITPEEIDNKDKQARKSVDKSKQKEDKAVGFGEPIASEISEATPSLASAPSFSFSAPASSSEDQNGIKGILDSIDQQLGVFSLNMALVARASTEQLEIVKSLAEVIQNQAFNEVSLSLSSLSESMSAAMEPMKAVSELVPSIDSLVSTLEANALSGVGRESQQDESAKIEKLTPEQLVMNLADQLGSGLIDPFTFKFAYMAVFPSEHPADLLRKLVDLLGTQRLNGDLFRAAYDAVQAPDPPRPVYQASAGGTGEVREVIKVVQDETVMAQIDELKQFNEEMRHRLDLREEEFSELLAAKDQEVQDKQDALDRKLEEFASRYDELAQILTQRTELLQERDAELSRRAGELAQKDSEIGQLKTQLDEIRDQTKDMVADLQKQLTKQALPEEKPRPVQSNFFETAGPSAVSSGGGSPLSQVMPQNTPINRDQQSFNDNQSQSSSGAHAAQTSGTHQPIAEESIPEPTPQAIPRPNTSPPTTPFPGAGAGSYGSGVRAQVFEVIVRQALAGAPWREICAGPMQVNNISAEEVESEVKRRQNFLGK